MLDGAVFFDFIMIQYYNNGTSARITQCLLFNANGTGCGVSSYIPGAAQQWNFNFDVWENWASTVSKNPNVKLLLGIPGRAGAGAGYVSGDQLKAVVAFSKSFPHFGGIMIWDMSQLYLNQGFLAEVVSDLGLPPSGGVTTTLVTATRTAVVTTPVTTTKVVATPTGGAGVPQWGQCGGEGYTGPTVCAPPYSCVATGKWWSQCQ